MEWVTTSILFARLKAGEDDAWSRLVDRFKEPLCRLGKKVGLDDAGAEDVAQETLLVLLSGIRDDRYLKEKGRLSSWIYGIARFKALKALEDRRRREAPSVDSGSVSPLPDIPDERALASYWEGSWAANLLERSLLLVRTEVDPKTLAAFEGVVLAHETPEAVAARLKMTPNAVAIAKHRVLKRLRELRDDFENF